jgi:hypothetical protein
MRAHGPFRLLALFVAALLGVALVATTRRAAAAGGAPELRTQISSDIVSVGNTIQIQLVAMVTGGSRPTDPRPGNIVGFSLRGTSQAPTTQMIIANGVRTDKSGLTTTWTLRADKPGTFTVGPASVVVDGRRYPGQAVRITVLSAGSSTQRPQQGGIDPMDPWKGLFGLDPGGANDREEEPRVTADPKLSLDAARGQTAFLHATIDKARAVVGEQVTLSVLLYTDAMEREPDFTDVHEATAGDFLKRSLLDNDSQARYLGAALVGGRLFNVKLIRKSAFFPLKTGTLEIGPMTLSLARRGDVKRESELLKVEVTEPPVAGRPAGYAIGDVGRYSLTTEVSPRELERGGAVGVTVDLEGTGNLPAQLAVPTRTGVEWLTPETHEKMGATRGTERFGGKRTFSYVVRIQTAGDVDLGELQLPYWDPDARQYGVARAKLGTVKVKGTGTAAVADAPIDPLPGLPDARPSLAGPRPAARRLGDSPLYWLSLGIAPLAYPLFAGARSVARRARARRAERAEDPRTEMDARIAEAEARSKDTDAKALDLATARALEASAIACAEVNLRAASSEAAAEKLSHVGLSADDARAVAELHRECQAARFSPEDVPTADARARWTQARGLIKALGKARQAQAA